MDQYKLAHKTSHFDLCIVYCNSRDIDAQRMEAKKGGIFI